MDTEEILTTSPLPLTEHLSITWPPLTDVSLSIRSPAFEDSLLTAVQHQYEVNQIQKNISSVK